MRSRYTFKLAASPRGFFEPKLCDLQDIGGWTEDLSKHGYDP